MIQVVSTAATRRWHSHRCRKLPMNQYANSSTIVLKICNHTNDEKSEVSE